MVFIPTYNERDNIGPLVAEIRLLSKEWDLLLLDDNSPDGTGAIMDQLAQTDSRIRVIHRTGKLGIGSAHRDGIEWAYKQGYSLLVTMDADFTHSPTNILKLIEKSAESDVVVGSRYLQEKSLAGWNPVRKILTWTAHVLTTVLLGLKYDSTGAFRLYRLDRLPLATFRLVRSNSYSFFFESLHIINFNKFQISEIPIALPTRTYGSSKMSYRDAFKSLSLLLSTYYRTLFSRSSLQLQPEPTIKQEAHV